MVFARAWQRKAGAGSWPDAGRKAASVSFPEHAGCGDPIGSYHFSARQRLRHKAEFEHVYRSGQRYSQTFFQAAACRNTRGGARLGLAIAARSVGDSVARNRIRRLVREAFRLCQHDLPPFDIVVSARARARNAGAAELRADVARLFVAITANANAADRSR